MAKKESTTQKLVPDMPDDAIIEIQGEGLFVNGTREPYQAPVEVLPKDANASESEVAS